MHDNRRALVTLACVYFLSFASSGIQLPLAALALQNVGFSSSTIGLMWGARSLAGAIAPMWWGALADRRGSARPFLVATLSCGAVLLLALAHIDSPGAAVACFALLGALAGPSGSLLDGMVLSALGSARARFGAWRSAGTAGFGAATVLTTWAIERKLVDVTPAGLFPICAALSVVAAGITAVLCPSIPRPASARIGNPLQLLRVPGVGGLVATVTLLWCSHAAYSSFLAPLTEAAGLPRTAIAASVFAAIVVEMFAMSASGSLLQRFGVRSIVVGVAALAVVRWALTPWATTMVPFMALHALHGVTFGLLFTAAVAVLAVRVPEERRQAAQGLLSSSAFGVGGSIGSVVAGAVLQAHGAPATWWTMAAIAAVGVISAWRSTTEELPAAPRPVATSSGSPRPTRG